MPAYHEKRFSPYSPDQLFQLVADVDKYPEFLPWCRAARVFERNESRMVAELVVCFKHVCEQYTSEINLMPHSEISVKMIRGPFDHLTNFWRFVPKNGGTEIEFTLDFKFKSIILEKLIGSLFGKATQKMAAAFLERADKLYGKKA